MSADVHVSVIAMANRELLGRCLDSVFAAIGDLRVDVTVVDNLSADGSRELVDGRPEPIRMLRNTTRLGFGANHNQVVDDVVAQRSARYILVLNDDVELQPGALQALVAAADGAPASGAVGPALVGADGTRQESVFAFPTVSSSIRGSRPARDEEPRWLNASCLLLRVEALGEIGGFDERFFLFYEDTDLGRRLADAGWQAIVAPAAVAVHHEHGTVGAPAVGGAWTRHQFERSRFLYLRKHHGRMTAHSASALLRAGLALRALKALAERDWPHARVLASDLVVPPTRAGEREVAAARVARPSFVSLGASGSVPCGMRDYDQVVRRQLLARGHGTEVVWSLGDGRARAARRAAALARGRAQAIVWHYSPFPLGHRGIPTSVPAMARAVRRAEVPVVLVLHELAYPFGRRGWRGAAQAATQRVALWFAVRAASGLVVTTDERAAWLSSRKWLPAKPLRVAPVFSNLPSASRTRTPDDLVQLVVFGFRQELAHVEEVVGAVAILRAQGLDARLTLLGAPGAESSQARRWRAAAAASGVGALTIAGVVPDDRAAQLLADADVVLVPDAGGPSSRKGTMAAALAAGARVVAFDGPETWPRLARSGAIALVAEPSAEAFAEATRAILDDDDAGARAAAFARAAMTPSVAVEAIRQLAEATVEASAARESLNA